MDLKFTKMEGCGNDYIYINGFGGTHDIPQHQKSEIVRRLSDRHFGIGGDGVIFINPSEKADFEMEMYNADGSRGEMCGNGIRCVGKLAYDSRMTDKSEFTVESFGIVHHLFVTSTDANGNADMLKVDMGAPILDAEKIPVQCDHSPVINEPIEIDGREYHMTCVSMGNPHCVIFVDDVDALDLPAIGPKFEHHPRFPKRVNTEFVQIVDDTHVKMRVWERGTGETLACGTGCCATCTACVLNGLTKPELEVAVRGGVLKISWDIDQDTIWMEGPARTVFEGVVHI